MAKKVVGEIRLQLPAGAANPAPPVGPALGATGVHIMAFCKEFNARTKDQAGLILPVIISVYQDKSFTFILKSPPASVLLLIDLAWNIDACELLTWCREHGVRYINTSTELWDPYATGANSHPTTKTLYWRHMNLRRMMAKWKDKGATAVIEHGANPGLISHFVKQGLIDIGESLIADKKLKAH